MFFPIGWAALHYASDKGYEDILEVLVNQNADINIVIKVISIMKMKCNF